MDSKALFHGSKVFRSNISKYGPAGLSKILFQGLCLQIASLVGVPTAAEIKGTVILVDITISKAEQSAAT
jgi:hypothetical protein